MMSSSLSSVVSNLVRASMGTAVSNTVTDEDLDRHVADLILKEAKKKAERYSKDGIRAYLPSGMSESNAPRTNKRFLSSIIRSTDDHNKTILRAQALAAQEVKREREEMERRERRARAEEAVAAERMRRSSGRRREWEDEGWDRWNGRNEDRKRKMRGWEMSDEDEDEDGYDRERESDRRRRRRHRSTSREWESHRHSRHTRTRDEEASSSTKRGRDRSGSKSPTRLGSCETDIRRDRERYPRHQRHDHDISSSAKRKKGRSTSRSLAGALSDEEEDASDEYDRKRRRRHSSRHHHRSHRKRRHSIRSPSRSHRSPSPSPGQTEDLGSRKRKRPRSPQGDSLDDYDGDYHTRRRSRRHDSPSPSMVNEDREVELRHKLTSNRSRDHSLPQHSRSSAREKSSTPERQHHPSGTASPKARSSSSQTAMSLSDINSRPPTPGPDPLPQLPSKMDKYFEESYDPRLDVAPLAAPKVPATGLIDNSEFEGWDAMLELIRIRREDKEEKKRMDRLGLTKDKLQDKKKGVMVSESVSSIMEIEYKKRGSVREWDLGKEGF